MCGQPSAITSLERQVPEGRYVMVKPVDKPFPGVSQENAGHEVRRVFDFVGSALHSFAPRALCVTVLFERKDTLR